MKNSKNTARKREKCIRAAVCASSRGVMTDVWEKLEGCGLVVSISAFSAADALLGALSGGRFDIIFIDETVMNADKNEAVSGTEIARMIRGRNEKVVTAMITRGESVSASVNDGLNILKYIPCPVSDDDILEALSFVMIKYSRKPYINVTLACGGQKRLPVDYIMYCERRGAAVVIRTVYGELRLARRESLKNLERALLPYGNFARCHRGYIVNERYAERIDKDNGVYVMKNGDTVRIRKRGLYMRKADVPAVRPEDTAYANGRLRCGYPAAGLAAAA